MASQEANLFFPPFFSISQFCSPHRRLSVFPISTDHSLASSLSLLSLSLTQNQPSRELLKHVGPMAPGKPIIEGYMQSITLHCLFGGPVAMGDQLNTDMDLAVSFLSVSKAFF